MANPKFRKTLLVGLGGAGKLILTNLKRQFLDAYGAVPPSVRLFSLDTDEAFTSLRSARTGKQVSLDHNEFLHLRVEQPHKFIEASETVRQWYVLPMPAGAIERGAGAVRQNGRLAFFAHIAEIQSRIDRVVNGELSSADLPRQMENAVQSVGAATSFELLSGDPQIYVCGSLAGGTASGTFLDLAFLLRHRLPQAFVQGFFLLNWLYRNKAYAYRVGANAYAALAELDHFQSITFGARGTRPYSIRYGDEPVEVTTVPYNLFHLIDGKKENGETVDDVEAICEAVASTIFLAVGSMGDRVSSFVDNLHTHINTSPVRVWRGKAARYSSLGLGSIYYPARELHEVLSVENAVALCRSAAKEIEEGVAGPEAEAREKERAGRIAADVGALFQRLDLVRSAVRGKVSHPRPPLDLAIQKFHVAAPELLSGVFEGAEATLAAAEKEHVAVAGELFFEKAAAGLRQRIEEIGKDPALDKAFLRTWLDEAIARVQAMLTEASAELQRESDKATRLLEGARQQLLLAQGATYLPWVGGPRKSAVEAWSQTARESLEALARQAALGHERTFHERVLAELRRHLPESVPAASEAVKLLRQAETSLQQRAAVASDSLRLLATKEGQVLVGNGDTVVVKAGSVPGAAGGGAGGGGQAEPVPLQAISVPLSRFKAERNVHGAQDYLRLAEGDPGKLARAFLGFCQEKLQHLETVSVHEALSALGSRDPRGEKGYLEVQLDHLLRFASCMWSYSRGEITEAASLQFDRVIGLGVDDADSGRARYDGYVQQIKGKHHIKTDHSYSTTGDPHRIWLLAFAGPLPLYLISDLRRWKERYEEEIVPTYHIDRRLEMDVPDLFPQADAENLALRVLGMAIVPGIDVIQDRKIGSKQGHQFTAEAPEVAAMNSGRSMVWRLFRQMYQDVGTAVPGRDDNLLDVLVGLLRRKVKSTGPDELSRSIQEHVRKLKLKMEERDFSRLVSARLTYREIAELERFLEPAPRGYGMDLDRYLAGK